MYNIFQKQIYIKHYNIIRASLGKLTSLSLKNCSCVKWLSHLRQVTTRLLIIKLVYLITY